MTGKLSVYVYLSVTFVLWSTPALCQMSPEELRRERQETMEELRQTEQNASGSTSRVWQDIARGTGWKFNYGGWYSPSFVTSNDNDRDAQTQDVLDHTWENDLRLYFLGQSAAGKNKVYFRAGTKLTRNSRASAAIAHSDWVQYAVDIFYYEHAFINGKRKQKFTLGRQFIKVKNTLAFGLIADGISFEFNTRREQVRFFAASELNGEDNIDFLAPGAGRSKRFFYGSEFTRKLGRLQNVNFFGVGNIDNNSDQPDAEGQRHRFDSVYLGATLFGSIFSRLEYELQYIREFGRTYSDTGNQATELVKIDANGIYAGLKYFFVSNLNPSLHLDYLFGSGDDDAAGNVFSSNGGSGSRIGTGNGGRDNRFIPLGGKNLGFALAPTLTNLHVVKTGFSLKPFGHSENRVWSDLKIHPQYYWFTRDKALGATADPYINRNDGASKKVGTEFDLAVTWKVMSDVGYTFKYGRFSPGPAYQNRGAESFLRLKVSIDL